MNFAQASQATDNVNAVNAQSATALTCGAECQQQNSNVGTSTATNAFLQQTLTTQAQSVSAALTTAFNDLVDEISTLAAMNDVTADAISQLAIIPPNQTTTEDLKDNVALRKAYYDFSAGNTLAWYYTMLRYVYIVMAIVYVAMSLGNGKSSFVINIIFGIVVLTFPLYITHLVNGVHFVLRKLFAYLPVNAYLNK